MSEFIGSRISLVSKADIRYVGTLHEINSEKSTVALENVSSFGTEGRKASAGLPDEEVAPTDINYDYIVFRGSDVKDLRIEEGPAVEKKPPQVPNDPAILGSSSRPQQPQAAPPRQTPQQQGPPGGPPGGPPAGPQGQQQQQGAPPPGMPPFAQYPPPFYPPPQGWGRGGPPPGPGFPGMPYGAPPGWYPPPGQGFVQPPGPFPPYGYPPPGQQFQPGQGPKPAPIGPSGNKQQAPAATPQASADKQVEPKSLAKPAELAGSEDKSKPADETPVKNGEVESPPTTQPSTSQGAATVAATRAAPTGPKNARVQPALPLQNPAASKAPLETKPGNVPQPANAPVNLRDATQAATAAVAAAMAKLPAAGGQANGNAVDNLTRKVNEMRTNDQTIRAPRQPGTGGFRGGRGRGGARGETHKVEVPSTDFDFESSNAKFNKEDLVKEAIAGSPLGNTPAVPDVIEEKLDVPVAGYNKSTSFFDNISSESKDRAEAGNGRPGGREWRGEEQKKNLETFGQGSVDNGHRGGYRGRGRGRGGRGRGYSGNGQPGYRGRGGYRGGRNDTVSIEQ